MTKQMKNRDYLEEKKAFVTILLKGDELDFEKLLISLDENTNFSLETELTLESTVIIGKMIRRLRSKIEKEAAQVNSKRNLKDTFS